MNIIPLMGLLQREREKNARGFLSDESSKNFIIGSWGDSLCVGGLFMYLPFAEVLTIGELEGYWNLY